MAETGHSGRHTPQATQSSLILRDIFKITSFCLCILYTLYYSSKRQNSRIFLNGYAFILRFTPLPSIPSLPCPNVRRVRRRQRQVRTATANRAQTPPSSRQTGPPTPH